MSNRASMGHIYDLLNQQGYHISYDEHNPPPEVSDDDRSPWFIQVLMLCGGLISASFMIGIVSPFIGLFLSNADPKLIAILGIVLGIIAIIGTITVASLSENVGAFKSGLLLPVHIVGQLMFIGGIGYLLFEWLYDQQEWLTDRDIATFGIVYLIVGVIYLVTTTAATRYFSRIPTFASFLYLISHIIGQAMVLFGVGFIMNLVFELWDWDTIIITWCIIAIALQCLFIVLYPNAIYRFLATLVVSSALFTIAFVLKSAVLISVLIGSLMFLAIVVWSDRLPARWQIYSPIIFHPVAYGAMLSAFALLIYEVSNRYISGYYDDMLTTETAFITTVILFVGLILLEITLMREYKIRIGSPYTLTIFGITLLVTLPVYATPGILAGIIGIILAFRRRNRILLVLSNVYLAGFIIYFYYWLEFTLLTKSIILMTTGVLLIVARLLLRRIVIVPDEKKGISA